MSAGEHPVSILESHSSFCRKQASLLVALQLAINYILTNYTTPLFLFFVVVAGNSSWEWCQRQKVAAVASQTCTSNCTGCLNKEEMVLPRLRQLPTAGDCSMVTGMARDQPSCEDAHRQHANVAVRVEECVEVEEEVLQENMLQQHFSRYDYYSEEIPDPYHKILKASFVRAL